MARFAPRTTDLLARKRGCSTARRSTATHSAIGRNVRGGNASVRKARRGVEGWGGVPVRCSALRARGKEATAEVVPDTARRVHSCPDARVAGAQGVRVHVDDVAVVERRFNQCPDEGIPQIVHGPGRASVAGRSSDTASIICWGGGSYI